VCVLWVRSCDYYDSLLVRQGGIIFFSAASVDVHGMCRFYRDRTDRPNPPLAGRREVQTASLYRSGLNPSLPGGALGFGWESYGEASYVGGQKYRQRYWGIQVPYWSLVLLAGWLPARWLWTRARIVPRPGRRP
jgi:hypothetical protein